MESAVAAALTRAGFTDGEFCVFRRGTDIVVGLGPNIFGGSAADLIGALRAAGFTPTPDDPARLLAGHGAVVTRYAYTTSEVTQVRCGDAATRHQANATRQWLERRMRPINAGQKPLLWPAGQVEAALREEAELRASGKSHPGNQTRGAERQGGRRRTSQPDQERIRTTPLHNPA